MRPEAEILLFSAARAQLRRRGDPPHLARGGVVLCDRFADSTLAYQGYGRGLDLEALRMITAFATGGTGARTLPFAWTCRVGRVAAHGRKQGGAALVGMESDGARRAGISRTGAGGISGAGASEASERWLVVDATQSVEQVQAAIRERVQLVLPGCNGDGTFVASTAQGGAYQ